MLASSATDAFEFIDHRIFVHQRNRLDRTLAHASVALVAVDGAHARLVVANRHSHADIGSHFRLQRHKRPRRTDVAAAGAGQQAISVAEIHFGLSEGF